MDESEVKEPMLKWFEYNHLPPKLRIVSREFTIAAHFIVNNIERSPERTVALRKLLESKDAAVRAAMN